MSNFIALPVLFFSLMNCSTFLIGKMSDVNRNIPKVEADVSYELVGWKGKDNKLKATEILKTLQRENKFRSLSHFVKSDNDLKIQIIQNESPHLSILLDEPELPVSAMIEKTPFRFSLYLLNRIVSAATRLLIPVIQINEEVIIFRVWRQNQKLAEFSYQVETVRAFGWVSLILLGLDDRKDIRLVYSDYAIKFLNESEKIYE